MQFTASGSVIWTAGSIFLRHLSKTKRCTEKAVQRFLYCSMA